MVFASKTMIVFLLACTVPFSQSGNNKCDDLVDNIIYVKNNDASNYSITINDGSVATYKSSGNPSCYNQAGNVRLPGFVQLVNGTITVKKAWKIVGNSVFKFTIRKESRLVGTLCENGKSKNRFVTDSDCTIDLCAEEEVKPLCRLLEVPNTYNIQNAQKLDINTTIPLPELSKLAKTFAKGFYKVNVDLVVNDIDTILNVEVPSSGYVAVEK